MEEKAEVDKEHTELNDLISGKNMSDKAQAARQAEVEREQITKLRLRLNVLAEKSEKLSEQLKEEERLARE